MMANLNNYNIISWDQGKTLGVVKDKNGRHLLGWSRDSFSDSVHILCHFGGEWRGTGLQKTIQTALDDLESRK